LRKTKGEKVTKFQMLAKINPHAATAQIVEAAWLTGGAIGEMAERLGTSKATLYRAIFDLNVMGHIKQIRAKAKAPQGG
tara:strand:+ start:984 stop:1220 length:237 start_codon:yes stop_codon:yes gene_type:complete